MTSLDMWLKGRFIDWVSNDPKDKDHFGQIIATNKHQWLIEEYYYAGGEWHKMAAQLFKADNITNDYYKFYDSLDELIDSEYSPTSNYTYVLAKSELNGTQAGNVSADDEIKRIEQ